MNWINRTMVVLALAATTAFVACGDEKTVTPPPSMTLGGAGGSPTPPAGGTGGVAAGGAGGARGGAGGTPAGGTGGAGTGGTGGTAPGGDPQAAHNAIINGPTAASVTALDVAATPADYKACR